MNVHKPSRKWTKSGGHGFSHAAMAVWERGNVDHRIRDANDYERHVDYVRLNPVEARIVGHVEDFPYSSARDEFTLDPYPQGLKPDPFKTT